LTQDIIKAFGQTITLGVVASGVYLFNGKITTYPF